MAGALDGVRVLELAEMVAGPYCAKLLADFGAEVVKIEPPGRGDEARWREPFYQNRQDPENSTLFLYLNANKKSITLDVAAPAAASTFLGLVAGCDVLIEDKPPGYLERLGLGYERLSRVNPRLVVTSITPFGQTGPHRNYRAYHLNVYHAGGDGYVNPIGLGYQMFPDRPPVQGGGYLADHETGLTAALATIGALFGPLQGTEGQQVDVSAQEAQIGTNHYVMYKLMDHGVVDNRVTHGFTAGGGILPCKDGYVQIMILEPHEFAALMELMGHPEWEKEERFQNPMSRGKLGKELNELIYAWSRTQEKEDLRRRGRALGLPIGIHRSPREVLESEQERVREFFAEVDRASHGRVRYPGAPCKFSRTPASILTAAPRLGQHNEEVFGVARATGELPRPLGRTIIDEIEPIPCRGGGRTPCAPTSSGSRRGGQGAISCELGRARADAEGLGRARAGEGTGGRIPLLEGIRIADFTWHGVGPYCTELLTQLGAECIKFESNTRLDLNRRPNIARGEYKVAEFVHLNAGKLSITLNLKDPKGVELAKRIVATSDLVVENFRPGVMARLGLGYEALTKVKPDIVMLSCSSYGQTGPDSKQPGYAGIFAAEAGLGYISGYPDGTPMEFRGSIDFSGGTMAAFAALAALYHYRRTGEGQYVDFSTCEMSMSFFGEILLDQAMNGSNRTRIGNRDSAMAPHNVYPSKGTDRWISIAVANAAEWAALCSTIGRPELIEDPRFASSELRWRNQESIDPEIAAWTRERTNVEAMHALQTAGVAAVPSYDMRELLDDPHLQARHAFPELEHPKYGRRRVVGSPYKLSGMPDLGPRWSPELGEHNEYVFGRLLGLSREEIEGLVRERVIY